MRAKEQQERRHAVGWLVVAAESLHDLLHGDIGATPKAREAVAAARERVKRDLLTRAGDLALYEEGSPTRRRAIAFLTAGEDQAGIERVLRAVKEGPL